MRAEASGVGPERGGRGVAAPDGLTTGSLGGGGDVAAAGTVGAAGVGGARVVMTPVSGSTVAVV